MKKKMIRLIITAFLPFLLVFIIGVMLFVRKSVANTNLNEEISVKNEERIKQADQEGIPAVIVSNANARPGDKITVTATIVNNPGILGMSMTLSYDENVMRLIEVENGDAVKDVLNLSSSNELKSGCIFLWDGENITSEQIIDGEILTMEFEINESAPIGKSPVLLISDKDGIVDNDLEPKDLTIDNGFVTIVQ